MQVVNVASGGTLQQHLPDVVGDGITQRQQEPGGRPTHWMTLSIHGFGPTKPSI
jgi:gamma-glutamyl-gamma-aminobutyrate hydrolase PuuD